MIHGNRCVPLREFTVVVVTKMEVNEDIEVNTN